MPITRASDLNIRDEVRRYLADKRARNPAYRVLEIGAAANPQYDDLVDAYVDLMPVKSLKPSITGDINYPEVWEKMAGKVWDFAICSHVLEDIRDPVFVLRMLATRARAGFIAVPNKHTEFAAMESWLYVGYSHHRWIFTVQDRVLRLVAKWPIANYFSRLAAPARWIGRIPGVARLQLHLGMAPGGPGLAWLDRRKIRTRARPLELGVLWENDLPFEVINNDYAGHSYLEQIRLYRDGLRHGL